MAVVKTMRCVCVCVLINAVPFLFGQTEFSHFRAAIVSAAWYAVFVVFFFSDLAKNVNKPISRHLISGETEK